jgi:hypothetical protein
MSSNNVTHKEIYDRLVAVEGKVDALGESTKDVVAAFAAAQGAFKVLETLSKLARPLLWLGGLCVAAAGFWDYFRGR